MRDAYTFSDIEDCYGASNLTSGQDGSEPTVKMVTAAPERGNMSNIIPGHGGLMDRLDSLIPNAFVSWALLGLFLG